MKSPRTRKDRPSAAVNGTISGAGTQQAVVCEVCLKPIRAGRWGTKRFCSPAHRLLSWAVDALVAALREGRAEGLRPKVAAIAGEFKIKVVHTRDDGWGPSTRNDQI